MSAGRKTSLKNLAGFKDQPQEGIEISFQTLQDVEDAHIARVYAYYNGYIPKVADVLDVSPSTVYRWRARQKNAGISRG